MTGKGEGGVDTPSYDKKLTRTGRRSRAGDNRTQARIELLAQLHREEVLSSITNWALVGVSLRHICSLLKAAHDIQISQTTLQVYKQRDERIRNAFNQGEALLEARLLNTMFNMAMDGHFGALKWMLAIKCGLHEPKPGQEESDEVIDAEIESTAEAQICVYIPDNGRDPAEIMPVQPPAFQLPERSYVGQR